MNKPLQLIFFNNIKMNFKEMSSLIVSPVDSLPLLESFFCQLVKEIFLKLNLLKHLQKSNIFQQNGLQAQNLSIRKWPSLELRQDKEIISIWIPGV